MLFSEKLKTPSPSFFNPDSKHPKAAKDHQEPHTPWFLAGFNKAVPLGPAILKSYIEGNTFTLLVLFVGKKWYYVGEGIPPRVSFN